VHGNALVAAAGRVSHSETYVGRFDLTQEAGGGTGRGVGSSPLSFGKNNWTLLRLNIREVRSFRVAQLVVTLTHIAVPVLLKEWGG